MFKRLMLALGLLIAGGCLPAGTADVAVLKEVIAKTLPWCNGVCVYGIDDQAWPES